MKLMNRLEPLGLHDYSFLLDKDDNHHIIVVTGIYDKFDGKTMQEYFLEKTKMVDKCQSKLVKKFGLWWYQKLTEKEWAIQSKQVVCEVKEDIHDDETLKEFSIRTQCTYDMYDAPQYRILLIPDYQPDKSAIVMKVHHNMSDGLGIATFI